MTIEINWGPSALSEGFGAVQDVIEILDFAVLETDTLISTSASEATYSGFLNGETTFVTISGSGLTYSDGQPFGGTITSMTVYRDDGSASVQQIVTFTGTISANELYNVAVGELTGSDIAAMETFFGAQDYIYNGTSADDIFPEGATSVDGIVFNLTGDDDVKLLQGDDIFSAGDGNDTVKAASGDDSLYGGEGNDRLFGSTGNDYLEGGNGNDLLSGQRDNDDLFGGEGNDTLRGGSGEDFLVAGEGRDFNKAGFNDDVVFGGGGNDVISGNAGDDVLHGGAGDDLLRGGGGVDLMFGEAGDDRLKGGSGGDEFIMDASNGNDVIIDWDDEDTLIFADITEVTEEPGDEPFNVTFFDEVGISFTTPSALIADYASVTADGVLFDFGIYGSMLLEGLTTTDGLEDGRLSLTSIYFADDVA